MSFTILFYLGFLKFGQKINFSWMLKVTNSRQRKDSTKTGKLFCFSLLSTAMKKNEKNIRAHIHRYTFL
jgi:hypothetical protein